MRAHSRVLIVMCCAMAAVTVAVGQPPPGQFGKGKGGQDINYVTLLQNPQVRAALNVTDEQFAKLPAASLKALAEVLTDKQLQRLREIYVQQKSMGKGKTVASRVVWPKGKKVPELPKPDADGFITLFNGKDLTNWEGLDGYWSVKDGVIDGSETQKTSKQTFLILAASWAEPAKFADFELRFKYKFATPAGNSGLQFRSWVINDKIYGVGGYQADFDANCQYDGGFYDEAGVAGGRGIMANRGDKTFWDASNKRINEPLGISRAALGKLVKKGDWNAMTVTAQGNHMSITINGQLMGDLVDDSPKAVKDGVIAFQMHAGFTMSIQVKDVRIKLLTP
jgi:hypothetical protein